MLGKRDPQGRFFNHYVYGKHLPREHELVRIHEEVDFSFVEEETRDLYEERMGRPSWPPEVLFRMIFLEYYSNLSDVQVAEQCVYNLLYRWLVGLGVGEATPDDTTLVVFRKRLGRERMERFFSRVNEQAKAQGLLVGRNKILDATHSDCSPGGVELLQHQLFPGRRPVGGLLFLAIRSFPGSPQWPFITPGSAASGV